jgi:glycosyltransferase involved in cell wall biosynthesis
MKVLFVHQNFPAQFGHLAAALAADPDCEVAAIGSDTAGSVAGVRLVRYSLGQPDLRHTHNFARRFDLECRRAEQVLYAAGDLIASGFTPDVVVVHHGWGEALPLRAAFPQARLVLYCEYYYQAQGGDVGFDPADTPLTRDAETALRARNAATLLALTECDIAISPTKWQRSTFPSEFQSKIRVIHEGIDTREVRRNPTATFSPRAGLELRPGDEVITFVARDLEPIRGYPTFMRALPRLLAERPRAHVVIVGGDGTSYGAPPPEGDNWKEIGLRVVADKIDLARVHFVGRLARADFLSVLSLSAVHVYLTAPFVLSWSMLEAMAMRCPIIASDTAPCREVINDGVNGLLVDFFDADALAAAVAELLKNQKRGASLGYEARRTVKKRYRSQWAVQRMREQLFGKIVISAVKSSDDL